MFNWLIPYLPPQDLVRHHSLRCRSCPNRNSVSTYCKHKQIITCPQTGNEVRQKSGHTGREIRIPKFPTAKNTERAFFWHEGGVRQRVYDHTIFVSVFETLYFFGVSTSLSVYPWGGGNKLRLKLET